MIITVPGPIPSKRHEEWFKNARYALIGVKPARNISSIAITFFWPDRRRRDMSNSAESIMDLLVDGGIIEDDSWQYVPRLFLFSAGVDKAKPRAKVVIHD